MGKNILLVERGYRMKEIWEKQLMTGVQEIDIEHRTLIETVDALQDAMKSGKGKEEVLGTLNFLKNYVKIHFKHEEGLQEEYDYPEIEAHKVLHEDFVNQISNLSKLIEVNTSTTNAMKVTYFCMEWLKEHIGVEDRKLAQHILAIRNNK